MMKDITPTKDIAVASIGKSADAGSSCEIHGRYVAQCFDKDGNLKWEDHIDNLITTVGKNDALDKHLSGSGYTAAWYMGLISSSGYGAGPNVADTAASHSGWAEDATYSQGSRPTCAFSAAAAGSKALSSALQFSINGTTTIKGCFIISNATKSGTTGILYSVGLFSGGDKGPMASGDTLSVTYSSSLT